MSKSTTMLRTRRKDNNVKPNRRLDRKSSRGMIYENEELRLRTININAEVERGQSDIKKLRRENEMLKKEIWCLRDGYDKLERLIKEKGIDSSSSTTTCSSSDEESSCSSCTEGSQEVETSQNLENVQKTNLKNFHAQFDHLSVVPEENSTENSEKNSTRTSLPNDTWTSDVIQPDQSYPIYENVVPPRFFAPIPASATYEQCENEEFLNREAHPDFPDYHQRVFPEVKSTTDLIVKTDNRNFQTTPSQSTFSNGGNLEELLNDIESISQDILKISTSAFVPPAFVAANDDVISRIQNAEASYVPNSKVDNLELPEELEEHMPFKSEINVVLMPTPMPLIGFDKYRNIQRSCESISLSASQQNLKIIPEAVEQTVLITSPNSFVPNDKVPLLTLTPSPSALPPPLGENRVALNTFPAEGLQGIEQTNPFFFGSLRDSYFNARYNPETFEGEKPVKIEEVDNSKSEQPEPPKESEEAKVEEPKKPETKSPRLSIRRKVSIHFKGKKDKNPKPPEQPKPKNSVSERKSLFEKIDRKLHQKTPSLESKKSDVEPKTPSSDSKTSKTSGDPKSSSSGPDVPKDRTMSLPNFTDGKPKQRKSTSVSPDRKHVHMKDEGSRKCHKKHRKEGRPRTRRSSISTDRFLRERSFSVCTDRSLGLGFGSSYLYDEYNSDRERTNSLSSCETVKTRKMSNISNVPLNGKIPWCGCWGNGCV